MQFNEFEKLEVGDRVKHTSDDYGVVLEIISNKIKWLSINYYTLAPVITTSDFKSLTKIESLRSSSNTGVAIANIAHILCYNVLRFIKYNETLIQDGITQSSFPPEEISTFMGYYFRLRCWLSSLEKLMYYEDFQASSAGCRSLFEILIDNIFLVKGAKSFTCKDIILWEDSKKLKYLESITNISPANQLMLDKFKNDPDLILYRTSKRNKLYYPDRWTKNANLSEDVNFICNNNLFPEHDLNKFYLDVYPKLCWDVHGSGSTSFRHFSVDDFPNLHFNSLYYSHIFSEFILKLICDKFNIKLQFDKLLKLNEATKPYVWAHYPNLNKNSP